METVQLGVRIPFHLNENLLHYLVQTGQSKTEVVVNALTYYLGSSEDISLSKRVKNLEARVVQLEMQLKT